MMKLRRGGNIVLGLTDENLLELVAGKVIRVHGHDIAEPGITLYLVHGNSHEEMREDLAANGYDVGAFDGKGPDHDGRNE